MTTIRLYQTTLGITFTNGEKIAGLVRNQQIPLDAIRSVEVVPDGLDAVRGMRAPGLALPGHRMVGTWRSRTGKALLAVHGRRPALRIALDPQRQYTYLLITPDDADELAAALTSHVR